MLTSFFFLILLTLSASSQRILPETQHSKSFLRTPKSPGVSPLTPQQGDKTAQNHPEISSEALEETGQSTAGNEKSPLRTQRMLQNEPVLTSIKQTTIRPPPGPGSPSKPTVVTTETYVLDVKNEEEIIITVENNLDPLEVLEALGTEQPQIVNGEDVFISSWWTIEDEEMAFEDWEQLESFLGAQYGSEPQVGIDVNAEDVPVELEIVVSEVPKPPAPPANQGTQNINEDLSAGVINLTDIVQGTAAVDWGQYEQEEVNGVEVIILAAITTRVPQCKQVQTCQRVFVRPIGFRKVCKNQLVCPKK